MPVPRCEWCETKLREGDSDGSAGSGHVRELALGSHFRSEGGHCVVTGWWEVIVTEHHSRVPRSSGRDLQSKSPVPVSVPTIMCIL